MSNTAAPAQTRGSGDPLSIRSRGFRAKAFVFTLTPLLTIAAWTTHAAASGCSPGAAIR